MARQDSKEKKVSGRGEKQTSKAETPKDAKPVEVQGVGRPPLYSREMQDAICELLATGHSMASICAREGFPSFVTVWTWEAENEEFLKASTRARELGTHYMADECIAIADDGTNDTYKDEEGNTFTNYDVIARSKLRIETRMRLIGKWNAKAYGDKLELNAKVKHGTEVILPHVPAQ